MCDRCSYPHGDEEWHIREAGEQCSVQEIARVSDEDLLQDLNACGTGRVEDLGGGKGLDVVGCGHLDVSDDIEEDAETERLQTTENIGNLSHGRLDDGCGKVRLGRKVKRQVQALQVRTIDHTLDYIDRGDQGMKREVTRGVDRQVDGGLLLERGHTS